MRQLNHDLKRLQDDQPKRRYATQRDRSYLLAQAADTLHEMGFRRLRATGLRRKHVNALVREWKARGLSVGTMKNRMAALRWWAEAVGRPGVVGTNAEHAIGERRYVTNEDRSQRLDPEELGRVRDEYVRMALKLQAAFGLRREEAIKFRPAHADRGDWIALKASTTKGGRPREIPVWNNAQRVVLDEARGLAGGGAMIAPGRNYVAQKRVYEKQTEAAGLARMHGLRHAYAQDRYERLTGWKPPAAGGPRRQALSPAMRRIDAGARLAIARELGHGRPEIVAQYCGA